MIELVILVILILLVIAIIRPQKSQPLVIERPGQHHMTLAPQLKPAQALIEAISEGIRSQGQAQQDSATLCFEVSDEQAIAQAHKIYLLAITRRNGMLYFQAVSPQSEDQNSRHKTISEFAASVLVNLPATGALDPAADEIIAAVTQETARLHGIGIKPLTGAE